MKIKYIQGQQFKVENNKQAFTFENSTQEGDFSTQSQPEISKSDIKDRVLTMPGEFEINQVLIRGVQSDNQTNLIFKANVDEMVVVHLGTTKEAVSPEAVKQLGENVDVLIFPLNEDIKTDDFKKTLEQIEPRMAIFCGDDVKMNEATNLFNAQKVEDGEVKINRSSLSDEVTQYFTV